MNDIGISISLGYCTYHYLGLGMWYRMPDEEARWFPEVTPARNEVTLPQCN